MLADSPARVLISGFMGHGATHFCAYCTCTKNLKGVVGDDESPSWTLRNGPQVRKQANIWHEAKTKSGKQREERSNGVRYTALHQLEYWDPVKHVVLGFMHNWLEGILQEQLRTLWGIGRKAAYEEKAAEEDDEQDERWNDTDATGSQSETDELSQGRSARGSQRSQASGSFRSHFSRASSPPASPYPQSTQDAMSIDDPMSPGPSTPTASTYSSTDGRLSQDPSTPTQSAFGSQATNVPSTPLDAESVIEPQVEPLVNAPHVFNLPDSDIDAIRQCIRDVTLPTWVGRPPCNLGEAKHGKLRANDYLVLFSFILPLVVPELWHGPQRSEVEALHLKSFEDLVVCTNIICAFKTSDADADLYTSRYREYRKTLKRLFPFWPVKPNAHYAEHNGELLKYWGPLAALSEFAGERLIGLLQDINTNQRLRKY